MTPSEHPTVDADDHETVVSPDRDDAEITAGKLTHAESETDRDDSSLILGRYRLGKRLGSGAFGLVHRARDERLDRDVAVKVLPRERVVFARFEREARAAARLQHPGVVTLYEAAVDDEGAYLVSELVRGKTLDNLLAAGKLSDEDILQIGIALCDALEHAHALGVIHRDVKPSNVLVPTRPGAAGSRAKLTDFGVAHVVGGEMLTSPGDVIGTAAYMSPEQAEGRQVGPETDLYALALVLYEALAGVNPVTGSRARMLPPLRRQRRDLPRDLGSAIDMALSPRPRDRGTVADLRAALVHCTALVDDTPGVVAAGWGANEDTRVDDQHLAAAGPEWRETVAEPRSSGGGRRAAAAALARPVPEWLPRGLNAAAAGLTAGWLSVHLLQSPPIAPAAAGLVAAAAVLLLPRAGWTAVIFVLTILALIDGHAVGALAMLVVLAPGIFLLTFEPSGAALAGGAAALGVIGLAGAWPAIVARVCPRMWQRAVVGGMGFVSVVAASILWRRNLYWEPAGVPAPHVWLGSLSGGYHQVLLPLLHTDALLGALVWAVVAMTLPLVIRGTRPVLDLIVAVVAAAVTVSTVEALGAHDLHHATLGAVVAVLVSGGPAIWSLGKLLGLSERPRVADFREVDQR